MRAALVLTSINDPMCLHDYHENFKKYDHLHQVDVFMIPDVKTPQKAGETINLLRKLGLHVEMPSFTECTSFLNHVGAPEDMFPINSDSRRNIGYLMALARGADFIISIDDDNYCRMSEDYFERHALCCLTTPNCLSSDNHWVNPIDWLDTAENVYQRGFPYFARYRERGMLKDMFGDFPIHANQGLWLGDPDMDALTWLAIPDRAIGHSQSIVLSRDTWAPVNSQNTAIRAEAMAAYYFIPMDGTILNRPVDRFGDIFQGYFLQACMKHLGGYLRIGSPIVDHRRNSHNYFEDAEREWMGIRLLEEMLPWLVKCKLTGSTYHEVYRDLATRLSEWAMRPGQTKIVANASGYLCRVANRMRTWATVCKAIGAKAAVA